MTEEEDKKDQRAEEAASSSAKRSILDSNRFFAVEIKEKVALEYLENEISGVSKIGDKYYYTILTEDDLARFGCGKDFVPSPSPMGDVTFEIKNGVVFPVECGVGGGSACVTTSAGAAGYGNSSVIIESPVSTPREEDVSKMPMLGAADGVVAELGSGGE